MTLPRIFSACVGFLITTGGLIALWRSKTRRFKGAFWFALGVAMLYASFRPQFIEAFGEDTSELRLRLVVVLLSFLVLTLTLEFIRTGRMQERYAFLWLASGSALLLGSLYNGFTVLITRLTGMSYADTVLIALFGILLLIVFSLSTALSRLHRNHTKTTVAVAELEERVRRIEQRDSPGVHDLSHDKLEAKSAMRTCHGGAAGEVDTVGKN